MYVYNPGREDIEKTNLYEFTKYSGISEISELYSKADSDPEWFWDSLVKYLHLSFFRPYESVMDDSRGPEIISIGKGMRS
ncbi:MAG: acetyl-coenzyme A synthetase N-terminal domain-containing protein [Thermoplasmata archaeon]